MNSEISKIMKNLQRFVMVRILDTKKKDFETKISKSSRKKR